MNELQLNSIFSTCIVLTPILPTPILIAFTPTFAVVIRISRQITTPIFGDKREHLIP